MNQDTTDVELSATRSLRGKIEKSAGKNLVAQVDERHRVVFAAEFKIDETTPEVEGIIDITYLESDVVELDGVGFDILYRSSSRCTACFNSITSCSSEITRASNSGALSGADARLVGACGVSRA